MTNVTSTRQQRPPIPDDRAALHADIEDARNRLGETMDEIGHRLDVKTRVKEAAEDASHRVSDVGHRASERVNDVGRRKPVQIVGGGIALAAVAGASVLAWRRWVS